MSRSAPSPSPLRRAVASLLLVHLFALLALAACPRLHHWVHPDADDDDHDCAVVWWAHGAGDAAAGPVALPTVVCLELHISGYMRPPVFVPSVFAVGGVCEHAPPRMA